MQDLTSQATPFASSMLEVGIVFMKFEIRAFLEGFMTLSSLVGPVPPSQLATEPVECLEYANPRSPMGSTARVAEAIILLMVERMLIAYT